MKKNVLIISSIMIAVLILAIGGAYALFTMSQTSTKVNTVTVGSLTMTLTDNAVSLTNAVPQSDTSGKTNTAYNIAVKNTGTLGAKYNICLVPTVDLTATSCTVASNTALYGKVKYNIDGGTPALLSTLSKGVCGTNELQLPSTYTLAKQNDTKTTALRIWYDSTANTEINGCKISLTAKVVATQTNQ